MRFLSNVAKCSNCGRFLLDDFCSYPMLINLVGKISFVFVRMNNPTVSICCQSSMYLSYSVYPCLLPWKHTNKHKSKDLL